MLRPESAYPDPTHSAAPEAQQLRLVGSAQVNVGVSKTTQLVVLLEVPLQLVRR